MITKQEFIQINYSGVQNYLPTGYTDKIYLEKKRIKRIGIYPETFRTEEKHKTVFSALYKNQLIQSINYDLYRLEFLKTESANAEILQFAQSIVMYDYGAKKNYLPVITELRVEPVGGTSFQKVTIEFYDTNIDNYPQGYPIQNELRSDVIETTYSDQLSNMYKVRLTPVATDYEFYTLLFHKVLETDPENVSEHELNGYIKTGRLTTKTKYEFVLFLKDSDLQTFKKYAYQCTEDSNIKVYKDAYLYRSKEKPEIEITPIAGAIDINKVVLRITTTVTDTYKYTS